MAKFEIGINSDGDPVSKFAETLSNRPVELELTGDNMHPCRAIVSGAGKFSKSYTDFAARLSASDSASPQDTDVLWSLIETFQDVCYKTTELLDVYEKEILRTLPDLKNKHFKTAKNHYLDVVKGRRRDWALICNKIKHEHNKLFPVRQTSIDMHQTVRGFTLFVPFPADSFSINKIFHQSKERSRQFDLMAHQVVHDVFRCDYAAAQLLLQLPISQQPQTAVPVVPFAIGPALTTVSQRQVFSGDYQPTFYDGFVNDGQNLTFRRQKTIQLQGERESSSHFIGDGFANSFQIP